MPKSQIFLWILLSALFAAAAAACASPVSRTTASEALPLFSPDQATLELHAHLFMKEGMTWMFRGEFDGPLRAKNWKSRFSSQANPETLDRSELGVVVVTLYAHPLLTHRLRDSIRRQLALAEQFVAEHPRWIIARSPSQVRAALAQGKQSLVLALEGADGIIENEEDLKEFVDEKGIRIVTLLHLTDDSFGGVAFLRGIRALATPWAFLSQAFHPSHDESEGSIRVNANGLSEKGRSMAQALIHHHVWIDLSHASDRAQKELITIQENRSLPLLYTHTSLRKYLRAERGISDWQLGEVKKTGGVVGLMPSEEMLEGTIIAPNLCGADCKIPCQGGIQALAVQYEETARAIGAEAVTLGSDYNGGIPHLHPSCPVGAGLDSEGLWNIGQVPEIWTSLEKLGAPVPQPRARVLDYFLKAWERIGPSS